MTAPHGRVEQLLAELEGGYDPGADRELEALKLALLLEDGLGVALDDRDIDRLREDGPAAAGPILARARREGS